MANAHIGGADMETRLRRVEDRQEISDRTITYALAIDLADWKLLGSCFTDPVHIDFSGAGVPARDFPRDEFVAFARQGLGGFAARQHLSPNHLVTFDERDPDRAVCRSYMFAQHYLPGAEGGDFYVMRGTYTSHMVRGDVGWRIERLIQHVWWVQGNTGAPALAAARYASHPNGDRR